MTDAAKGSGDGVTANFINPTSSPLDVILAVGSSNAADPGAFGLTVPIK